MLIFVLTPFDTSDCDYFELNLSLVLLTKIFLVKKTFDVVKKKIVKKNVKSDGFGEKIKRVMTM